MNPILSSSIESVTSDQIKLAVQLQQRLGDTHHNKPDEVRSIAAALKDTIDGLKPLSEILFQVIQINSLGWQIDTEMEAAIERLGIPYEPSKTNDRASDRYNQLEIGT